MPASASKQSVLTAHPVPAVAEPDRSAERSEPAEQPQREALIAEAAFFIAQQRGFEPGRELDDWLVAEQGVDQRLSPTRH